MIRRTATLVLGAGAALWLALFVAKFALVLAVLAFGLLAAGIGPG